MSDIEAVAMSYWFSRSTLRKQWKHPMKAITVFKTAVLGGMTFSWKIVDVLVKIWKKPSWKICSDQYCATFFRGVFIPGKFDLFLLYFVPPEKFKVFFEKIFHNSW